MVLVTPVGSWGAFWLFNDMLKVPLPIGDASGSRRAAWKSFGF